MSRAGARASCRVAALACTLPIMWSVWGPDHLDSPSVTFLHPEPEPSFSWKVRPEDPEPLYPCCPCGRRKSRDPRRGGSRVQEGIGREGPIESRLRVRWGGQEVTEGKHLDIKYLQHLNIMRHDNFKDNKVR